MFLDLRKYVKIFLQRFIMEDIPPRKPHRLERGDHMITTERVATYDKMARNLHHPSYRNDFTKHYDDLFRLNLKFHDLNYPAPPPEIRTRKYKTIDPMTGTMSTTLLSSRVTNSETRKKSKYMSTKRLGSPKKQITSFREKFIEDLKRDEGKPFADQERIIAELVRSLLKEGVEMETIQNAFEDVRIDFIVHQDTSELEIVLNF